MRVDAEERDRVDQLLDSIRDDHVGFNDKPLHSFLDEAYLDQYDSLLSQAREAVKDDAIPPAV